MYIYTHVYMHMHMYSCIYVQMHICIHVYMYVNTCIHANTRAIGRCSEGPRLPRSDTEQAGRAPAWPGRPWPV